MKEAELLAKFRIPEWGHIVNIPGYRDYSFQSGRAAAKSETLGRIALAKIAEEPIRIGNLRESHVSLERSNRQIYVDLIDEYKLGGIYEVRQSYIRSACGGSIFFHGIENSPHAARGWRDVHIIIGDEAQLFGRVCYDILRPSIRLNRPSAHSPISQFWWAWNPQYPTDPVYMDFGSVHPREGSISVKLSYKDNPWFPRESEMERRHCERNDPQMYPHIWLGELAPDDASRILLPHAMLTACLDAHHNLPPITGRIDVGLDVADTGAANNVMAARRGPLLLNVEQWGGATTGETTRRVDSWCRDNSAARLYYDSAGVGAGIRSAIRDLGRTPDYRPSPVNFGSAVAGPKQEYSRDITNADHFARRNIQMAWALRLRAENTIRLLDGDIGGRDPAAWADRCLFLDSNMDGIDRVIRQLAQPVFAENNSGKLVLDKAPNNSPSPDIFDAVCLAFARDSERGLRHS